MMATLTKQSVNGKAYPYNLTTKPTTVNIELPTSVEVNEQFYTYTFMTLIANLGGYIGLFTGASIFSMLEGGIKRLLQFDKLKAMLT